VNERQLAASVSGFACDEVVAFDLGVRLDGGQVRISRADLSCFHFDLGQRKASIEFDADKSHPSRLGDDGGQLLACRDPCGGVGGVFPALFFPVVSTRAAVMAVRQRLLAPMGLVLSSFLNLAHAQLNQLYAFQYNANTISNYPDGETPMVEPIQGADGNYYTTTFAGGSGACIGDSQGLTTGCGAVVKITPGGVFSLFYSFPYNSSNNTAPNGAEPQKEKFTVTP